MTKKFLSLIFILTFLDSCSLFFEPLPKSWNWGFRPRPVTGVRGFPEADTEYGLGFKNGCEMSWESASVGLLGNIDPTLDTARMTNSADYNNGWYDGMLQCSHIIG